MYGSKVIIWSAIVLLFCIFAFVMVSITFDTYSGKDELKFFLTGFASGLVSVILIPISEIEKEYIPRWYEEIIE